MKQAKPVVLLPRLLQNAFAANRFLQRKRNESSRLKIADWKSYYRFSHTAQRSLTLDRGFAAVEKPV
ncbi:MAG: hypothetical protein RML36_02005 [Anaerolineae bacterium]|nr:hypothetical protein [Anaerolineae bacterium]